MTLKTMRETLALKLEDKAKKQDANAIDTDAKDVDKPDNKTTNNADSNADSNTDSATADSRNEDFNAYLAKLKQATADISAFSKNEDKEVVQVIDTILGYIKTLEKTYNKVHATATPKDPKKNK
jgi:hypothetical protein